MQSPDRTRGQLLEELEAMEQRISELEASEARLLGMEKALRESEERFRLLYEYAPLGYQSLDENGYFLEVNRAWLDTLGYSREEVIGRWFGDFLAPGYQDHFKINFPKFKAAGEIHGVEFEMLRKDGSQISVAFDGQVGRDAQGHFRQTHCILHDITERKRVEEALQDSEERLRLTLEATQIGIWDWDVETDQWYASPTYCTMLGYEPDTGLSDRGEWLERVHPDDRAAVSEKIQNVLTRDFKEYQYEARLRHADGTYRWQHVQGVGIKRAEDGKVTRLLGIRM
ncbi:MAG: PAS domain S-box protein, partial [Candidatus Marsarchaeota archaeon]|nr:PAS domain S-box protein [Candidatus Marsarchaeota archaeon]